MTKTYLKGLLAAFILTIAGAAHALPGTMLTTGRTNPPIGHYEYCKSNPTECGPSKDTGLLELTEAKWKTILKVNHTANTTIEPLTDKEIYGVEERWAIPTTVGDCEDYVLIKQKMLVERGFSPSNLLITVVLQPNGDGHAVLTVQTDRGEFVLDNMRNKVLLWSDTEYTYLKRQSPRHAGQWEKIDDNRSPAVGSIEP